MEFEPIVLLTTVSEHPIRAVAVPILPYMSVQNTTGAVWGPCVHLIMSSGQDGI